MAITRKFSIDRTRSGEYLVDALARDLSCSKKLAKRLLDERKVFVNDRRIWMAKHLLKPGDKVEVQGFEDTLQEVDLPVIFKNQDYLVIAKPEGVTSDGEGSAETQLREQLHQKALRAVHRLDRDTTGCLLFALNEDARQRAITEFKAKNVKKLYLVIVMGDMPARFGRVTTRIDGKPAETVFTLLDRSKSGALLQAELLTGRMHQIRRHLGTLGVSVAGDKQYRGRSPASRFERRVLRQMLHAWHLELPALEICASARPPDDFIELAAQLKLRCPSRVMSS
jgi:23S rRNA-/tRNA-specific pseudouridylate synthase